MNFSRLVLNFRQLPAYLKFVGAGGLLLLISNFLPWYSDLDAYNIGDTFLGITGPTSFVGIAIFLLSLGSLFVFGAPLLDRRKPKLPVREGIFHLFVGLESLFLLLLVNSIYFHTKFGVNITLKESRFGMLLAVLGSFFLAYGGYVHQKKEAKTEDLIGKLEPLLELPKQVSTVAPSVPSSPERKHQPLPKPAYRTWGPVEISQAQIQKEKDLSRFRMKETLSSAQPTAAPEKGESEKPGEKGTGSGSFMVRMDL